VATREQNERRFEYWGDLPDGGRRYWHDIPDHKGGWSRYIKIVDANEQTLSFVQQVYDAQGRLVAIHEKYPVDRGHKRL
jgi:hypothetical protein